MAHSLTELTVVPTNAFAGSGSGNVGNHAYLYTNDTAATVEGAGYLNASVKRLPKGTSIRAHMVLSGTPVLKDYIVTGNNGTVVTIALATATAG